MVNCRGCGREIDTAGIEEGDKYLCARCYYLQSAGQETGKPGSYKILLGVVFGLLTAVAHAGIALCFLYLIGVSSFAWFLLLLLVLLVVVFAATISLLRRRNLALFLAAFYLPLGIWTYLWYLAPGVSWDRGNIVLWGAFLFLFIGLLSIYLVVRDFRSLPRI
jgi:hypothetical protein